MKRLKKKWGIDSNLQLTLIFIVFAITGSTAAKIAAPVCEFLGVTKDNSEWFVYWPLRVLLVFPIYQVLLVVFGTIFGQFQFFWNFEKKMLSRLGLGKIFNLS
ncbi:DUF6787 family protein [Gramella sp. AN32]|uniref:DUF6787 family protein n=1 Tax=Christiangramia antarctica TaxID=2058158 RepID=A0ABW5X968_9FLAO|nr:DUF6787 family protein [Gramella sp. AN32]MCM4157424.1 diacylglyceryl transferase [Gramella sp. AN32]